jgi:hypothetical protein
MDTMNRMSKKNRIWTEKITFRDYFEITRVTTNYFLKISGIIFTTIVAIIFVFTEREYVTNSIFEPVKWFVICCLLGNGCGLLIVLSAMISRYKQASSTIRFYSSIPEDIKIRHRLKPLPMLHNEKYGYQDYKILSGVSETPLLLFEKKGNKILVTIKGISFKEKVNFTTKKHEVNNKYKRKCIDLIDFGLRKAITDNDWNNLEKDITELIAISHNEGINLGILPSLPD